jgi:hypothetical protein
MTVSTIFGVAGPVFVGWMSDVFGNYKIPYLRLSITLLVAVPLVLTLRRSSQRRAYPGSTRCGWRPTRTGHKRAIASNPARRKLLKNQNRSPELLNATKGMSF